MPYVDGFIVPVPTANLAAYKALSKKFGKLWIKYGALDYQECVADDVKPGKWTSFPQSVKQKDNETVIFSWIWYKSKADRDRINKLVMNDPLMAAMGDPKDAPFDGKRMIYGGFKPIISLGPGARSE